MPKSDRLLALTVNWDFSIYPEMTEAQQHAVFSVGLTLLGIQTVEHATDFLLHWVFPSDPTLDLKALIEQLEKGTVPN